MSEDKSLVPCQNCGCGYEMKNMYRTNAGLVCDDCAEAMADEYWTAVSEEKIR